MFEFALLEDIKNNFTSTYFNSSIPIAINDVPRDTKEPYISMWVLDKNGTAQQLCDAYGDSGNSFIQFNIYTPSGIEGLNLKNELDLHVSNLRTLTLDTDTYIIDLKTHQPSPSQTALDNGLGVDVLAKTFNYKKG